jgi:hypothetical protein
MYDLCAVYVYTVCKQKVLVLVKYAVVHSKLLKKLFAVLAVAAATWWWQRQ